MSGDDKRERLCDLTTDELWEIACDTADQAPTLGLELGDEIDEGEDEDCEPLVTLKEDELKAPEGKFRLVLHDMVPAMAGAGTPEAYHLKCFDSKEEAIEMCQEKEAEYGTSFAVYDDKGMVVSENSAIPAPRILL